MAFCLHIDLSNLREVADRHPGVRREREARKRGPRHRFWRSAGAAGAAAPAAAAAAAADCDSAWEGSQKLKIGAPKRPFRVGGVAKVGDPAPQKGHSAWEGSQNLYIGNLPIVRLWRLLLVLNPIRNSVALGCAKSRIPGIRVDYQNIRKTRFWVDSGLNSDKQKA